MKILIKFKHIQNVIVSLIKELTRAFTCLSKITMIRQNHLGVQSVVGITAKATKI